MKNTLSYKVSGILAAVVAAAALGASAQTTAPVTTPAPDAQTTTPMTAPQTTVAPQTATPQTTTTQTTTPMTAPATAPANPAASAPAAAPAVAADPNAAKNFMKEAFMANEFSIAASQLAATQGESADVKATAQAVLDNGLKTRTSMVAAIQGSTSDMHFDQNFTDDYNMKLGELKAAKGADFDTKYVAALGEVNDKAENVFKSYAATGTDESVKTFAANTLPTLSANGDKLDSVGQGGN